MKKLLLVLFSTVLLLSCSADEVSREGSTECYCIEVVEESVNGGEWQETGTTSPSDIRGCNNDGLIDSSSITWYTDQNGNHVRVRRKLRCY